ncbi:hypothetical protein D3C85_1856170 [compost metagenome]
MQQLQHAVHTGDWRTQFVAHGGQETLSGLERRLCTGLSLPQFGDICQHSQHAKPTAVLPTK